jgi:hypothetical protein
MRLGDFLLGMAAGLVVYHLSNKRVGVVNPEASEIETKILATKQVLEEEAKKYSNSLRKDYDIVMPSDQISNKVRMRSKQLNDGRFSLDLQRQKPPLSI